jgi:hypothetical protein
VVTHERLRTELDKYFDDYYRDHANDFALRMTYTNPLDVDASIHESSIKDNISKSALYEMLERYAKSVEPYPPVYSVNYYGYESFDVERAMRALRKLDGKEHTIQDALVYLNDSKRSE